MIAVEPLDPAEYLERIERQFGLRRGGRLLLSPRDWQLVEGWRERGMPLGVVLRGINRAFDRFEANPRPDRINSLSYCAQQVEEVWQEEREHAATDGTVAREDPGVREAPAEHLRRVAESCTRAAREVSGGVAAGLLKRAAESLQELAQRFSAGESDPRETDRGATEIERELRVQLPELFTPEGTGSDGVGEHLPPFSPWSI